MQNHATYSLTFFDINVWTSYVEAPFPAATFPSVNGVSDKDEMNVGAVLGLSTLGISFSHLKAEVPVVLTPS